MGKFSDSDGELSRAGKCAMIFLIIVNIVFIVSHFSGTFERLLSLSLFPSQQILGIVTLAIGAFAIANGDAFSFVTGNTLIGGSAVLIIVGIAIVLVAAFGFLAAVCRSRIMLGIVSTNPITCI